MSMEREVRRAVEMYMCRDKDPAIQALWAPFAEDEVAHRTQQYFALATFFRSLYRVTLDDLKILDVGCGQGRIVRACLDMGASPESVAGTDIRSNAIAEAQRLSPNLNFRLGSGVDLEYQDEKFDLVTQFVVFSSIFSEELRAHLASEMVRVLKPGGYIFWWDCAQTIQEASPEPLIPCILFPGMPVSELPYSLRPRPSYCLRLPRGLGWLGRVMDRLGYPTTHLAALIGPKPAPV